MINFVSMVNNLSIQSPSERDMNLYITVAEFEEFKKECNFLILKEEPIGQAFCKKYNISNGVLSILSGDTALNHIKTFYVK